MTALQKAPAIPLDKVEWRVQGKVDRGGGVNVVAYLDAPTVADALDDWVGPDNWCDRYKPLGDGQKALWCRLSVWVEAKNRWVTKVDVGVPSSMEAAKGLVSDAFKRVAMRKWGVGRNVFDLPILRITVFDRWERNGEPQASLTDGSLRQIAELLRARGFDEAADKVRVSEDHGEATPADPPTQGKATAVPDSPPDGTPATDYAEWSHMAGVSKAALLTQARRLAEENGLAKPNRLEEVSGELNGRLAAWVQAKSETVAAA